MLNTILPIKCSITDSGSCRSFTPANELPSEFQLLNLPAYRNQVVKFATCPCCSGTGVPLLVNLIYQQQVVLLDCAVIYCLNRALFILPRDEEIHLRARWQQIREDNLVPLEMRRGGVGEKVSLPLIGSKLRALLKINRPDAAYYSAKANSILAHLPIPETEGAMPDAIGFHSNDLPEEMTLKIEPTTRCNFRCEFCYGRYIEQGSLRMEDFLKVLDQLPGVKSVEITGEGEPLVNHDLFEMLQVCAERGIWTHITTNGSLVNERVCARLLTAGLSSIAISLESINPENFARLRPGGKLETVLDAIRTIVRLRRELAVSLEFGLWITILRETVTEVDRIDEFARQTGVDYLQFQALNPMSSYKRFYSEELQRNILSLEEMEGIINDPSTSSTLRSALASVISVYRGRKCDIFTHTTMVYWQGEVTPCCLLKTPHFPAYGNLTQDSFAEIWNREEYRFFRFALQHGIVLRSCKECPDVASA